MPRSYVGGGLIVGDSASLLNSQRLKGIHIAIKSGMLAAETIYEALSPATHPRERSRHFAKKVEAKLLKKELWGVRNFHQDFADGLWAGLFTCRRSIR